MIFTATPTTVDYDVLRLVSQTGRWEFGLRRVIYGVRVCAGIVDSGGYSVDYCAGADAGQIVLLRVVVQQILEGQPEAVTPRELTALLPSWTVRPMFRDTACMDALVRLACDAQAKAGAA